MNLPNWITIIRIILIPFFVAMVMKYKETGLEYFRYYALAIFIIASVSDAVDGAIARIRHIKTQLGTLLDPLADKLLLMSAVVLFSIPVQGVRQLPIWILIAFISRDLLLIFGTVLVYIQNQKLTIKPNILGKVTTFTQMLTVVWILLGLKSPQIVWRTAGFFTILSGIVYLYQGSRQLGNNNDKNSNSGKA